MATHKTVWIAKDGSYHDTVLEADEWDLYCAVRDVLEEAYLDWRGGSGPDTATPDTVAELVLKHFDLTAKPAAGAQS